MKKHLCLLLVGGLLFSSLTAFAAQGLHIASVANYPQIIRVCTRYCSSRKRARIISVPFRQYVLDVLASEWAMPNIHYQTIKTAALLVKQYALYNSRVNTLKYRGFDVTATQADQVYKRNAFQRKFGKLPEGRLFKEAVNQTWDEVVVQRGQIVEAHYDAGYPGPNCGSLCLRPLKNNYPSVSQSGAEVLARRGYSMPQILNYYYGRRSPVRIVSLPAYPNSSVAQMQNLSTAQERESIR